MFSSMFWDFPVSFRVLGSDIFVLTFNLCVLETQLAEPVFVKTMDDWAQL